MITMFSVSRSHSEHFAVGQEQFLLFVSSFECFENLISSARLHHHLHLRPFQFKVRPEPRDRQQELGLVQRIRADPRRAEPLQASKRVLRSIESALFGALVRKTSAWLAGMFVRACVRACLFSFPTSVFIFFHGAEGSDHLEMVHGRAPERRPAQERRKALSLSFV